MSCKKANPQFFPSGAVLEKLSPVNLYFLQNFGNSIKSHFGKELISFCERIILIFLYSGTDFGFAEIKIETSSFFCKSSSKRLQISQEKRSIPVRFLFKKFPLIKIFIKKSLAHQKKIDYNKTIFYNFYLFIN